MGRGAGRRSARPRPAAARPWCVARLSRSSKTARLQRRQAGRMAISDGRPDGYTTLTPFLVCSPATEAISWYQEVLGATLVSRMDGPDGTVPHAELDFGTGRLQLGDPADAYGLVAPTGQADDKVSGSTCIYVDDVDAVSAKAVERAPRCGRSRPPSSPATGSPRSTTPSA